MTAELSPDSFHIGSIPPYSISRLKGNAGVVERVAVIRAPSGMPSLHSVVIGGRTASGHSVNGSGFDCHVEKAFARAFGEFVERFSLHSPPPSGRIRKDIALHLPGPVLDAERWPLFTEEQLSAPDFPWTGLTADIAREWAWCDAVDGSGGMWIPCDLTWIPTTSTLCLSTSTGAAAHRTRAEAMLSALLEVIERDALAITWETRAITPIIDLGADWLNFRTTHLIRQLIALGLNVILRDLTTDIDIPVVAAVIVDPSRRRPCLVLGTAARISLAEACESALTEAYAVFLWMRDEHMRRDIPLERARELAKKPDAPMWQAFLYGWSDMKDAARNLWFSAPLSSRRDRREPPTVRDALARVITSLAARGYSAYVCDVLAPELNGCGLHAVRSVIPGLVPLGFGMLCRPLANPRLRSVPAWLGWPHQSADTSGLIDPIPLP